VGRGADQLHAALVRLVVRLGALEAGQERMVDVDGPAFQLAAQVIREDLHVAREHHELDAPGEQLEHPFFCLSLPAGLHGDVLERQTE